MHGCQPAPVSTESEARDNNAGMNLDGEIRDGRHAMTVRVYYEDTDFTRIINIQPCSLCLYSVGERGPSECGEWSLR